MYAGLEYKTVFSSKTFSLSVRKNLASFDPVMRIFDPRQNKNQINPTDFTTDFSCYNQWLSELKRVDDERQKCFVMLSLALYCVAHCRGRR